MRTKDWVIICLTVVSLSAVLCWMVYEKSKPIPVTHSNTTSTYSLPKELKECQVFEIHSNSGNNLHVVRCPNASTTTGWTTTRRSGKTTVTEDHSVTVD